MKIKTLITAVLLLFVAVSIAVVVLREVGDRGSAAAAPEKQGRSAATTTSAEPPAVPQQFAAYYFRTNVRCPSCIKIEGWTDEAITANFTDELEDGSLVWETINTEESGNEHYVDDYQLYTKQVVLAEFADGQRVRYKDLARVWDLLGDQQAFSDYIVGEVKAFMAGENDEEAREKPPAEGLDTGGED
jgi:hypothetical protein